MSAAFAHDNAALAARIAATVRHPPTRPAAHTTRRLRRRPRRSSFAPIGIAAALAAALVLGVLAFWHLGQSHAQAVDAAVRLASVADARLTRASGSAEAGGDGMAVAAGDQVWVGAQGAATLAWAREDTAIALAAGSRATLERADAGKRLRLDAGELSASVAPQPAGQPLIISTAQCAITVVGTRFTLAATPTRTRLRVAEGLVRMRAVGATQEVAVAAGQEADASDGKASLAQATTTTPPVAIAAPAASAGDAPFAGGTSAWKAMKGSWQLADGVATLASSPAGTLIQSRDAYRDFELTCRIHAVAGRTYAELQLHDGSLSIELLRTVDEHDWKDVRVVVRGAQVDASVNGSPQAVDRTGRNSADRGAIGFFVGTDRTLEIADLRIRVLDAR